MAAAEEEQAVEPRCIIEEVLDDDYVLAYFSPEKAREVFEVLSGPDDCEDHTSIGKCEARFGSPIISGEPIQSDNWSISSLSIIDETDYQLELSSTGTPCTNSICQSQPTQQPQPSPPLSPLTEKHLATEQDEGWKRLLEQIRTPPPLHPPLPGKSPTIDKDEECKSPFEQLRNPPPLPGKPPTRAQEEGWKRLLEQIRSPPPPHPPPSGDHPTIEQEARWRQIVEQVRTAKPKLSSKPPMPPPVPKIDAKKNLLQEIREKKLRKLPERSNYKLSTQVSPRNAFLEEIRCFPPRLRSKAEVAVAKVHQPSEDDSVAKPVEFRNALVHSAETLDYKISAPAPCLKGDKDKSKYIVSPKLDKGFVPSRTKEIDRCVPVLRTDSLSCFCKAGHESHGWNPTANLEEMSNPLNAKSLIMDPENNNEKPQNFEADVDGVAPTFEACLSSEEESNLGSSDRESAKMAIQATNIALNKWVETQAMLAEAVATQREAIRGKVEAESKYRATIAMTNDLLSSNKRLHLLIDELQANVSRQRSDAEHVARAASALVLKHAAPASAVDVEWIGGVWLAVGRVHPQLAKAEKSWSTGHAQRALTELQGLLKDQENLETTPSNTVSAPTDSTFKKTVRFFSRAPGPASSVTSISDTPIVQPSTETSAPLTEAGILANLLRAAILLGAKQAAHGAAVAAAMIIEAQHRQEWQLQLGEAHGHSDLIRRARWIQGVCLLRQGRPAEARLAFALCAGTQGHEKVMDAYRQLADEETQKLASIDDKDVPKSMTGEVQST